MQAMHGYTSPSAARLPEGTESIQALSHTCTHTHTLLQLSRTHCMHAHRAPPSPGAAQPPLMFTQAPKAPTTLILGNGHKLSSFLKLSGQKLQLLKDLKWKKCKNNCCLMGMCWSWVRESEGDVDIMQQIRNKRGVITVEGYIIRKSD